MLSLRIKILMIMNKIFAIVSILCYLSLPGYSQDDDPDENPFDWLKEIEDVELDEGDAGNFIDQQDWKESDWRDQFKDYEELYEKKNASEKQAEAYQLAQDQGINMPQRFGPVTFDPETGELILEDDEEYAKRLNDFLGNLNDELTSVGFNLALELLYAKLLPLLKVLKEKNAAILKTLIPNFGGVITYDPVEEDTKEDKEGKRNFKYWVKLAAENILQNIFKENAEGKYELQREQLQLLQQVGVVRYLKMTLMDWELAQSIGLELPDEILSYASVVHDIYSSAQATVGAGKALYQSVTSLDTDLNIPTSLEELKEDAANIFANKLTTQEMVNTRRKLLAKTYQQLAARYREYGEDLNRQSKLNEFLKMSDSDRVRVSAIAQEYFNESLRLQAKSEDLVKASLVSAGPQNKDEVIQYYQLYRKFDAVLSQ